MIDISSEIFENLNTIAKTHKGYPQKKATYPCLSYYIHQNSDGLRQIPGRYSSVVFQVDVFSEKSPTNLALRVSEKMKEAGYLREFMSEIPDDSKVNRITMRFSGLIDEITGEITH